ncbi:hypothetical protein ABD86_04640 [Paenibacillus alvei]|nr:hypothetical protein [Paenibacillus alvei]MBG9743261.1 hypothetical protein [Paenibacillus alvei]
MSDWKLHRKSFEYEQIAPHLLPHSAWLGHRAFAYDVAVLIKSTFDEALQNFEDDSIHLLHIDGFHEYEAIHHDYHTWLPKVAENGIVLFHDISI